MSVTVILEMNAKPGAVEQLLAFMKEILPGTRSFKGCHGIEVRQNQEDPCHLVFLESWVSRGDYDKYRAWRRETGTMETLGNFMAGPPNVRYFDQVDV